MRFAPLLLALGVALGGCGGGHETGTPKSDGDNSAEKFQGEERRQAQVIEDFAAAIRGKDWQGVCDLLTPGHRELIQGRLDGSCLVAALRDYDDLGNLELTVERLEPGHSATVTTTTAAHGEASFTLRKRKGPWKIAAALGNFAVVPGAAAGGVAPSGSPQQQAAAQVVLDFDAALGEEDYSRACTLVTHDFFVDRTTPCEEHMRNRYGHGALGAHVTEVELKLAAGAVVKDGNGDTWQYTVTKQGGDWRLANHAGPIRD